VNSDAPPAKCKGGRPHPPPGSGGVGADGSHGPAVLPENKSKIEIAEEFGISRFKVARMLENAIRDGLIRLRDCMGVTA